MLSHLDETLNHQSTRPFRVAGLSDHRYFDRYWFEALDPNGAIALITGMAFYKNMGTCDGYVSVLHERRQHNVRLARPLDLDVDTTALGPLHVRVIEPFRHLHIELGANPSGLRLELDWRSPFPAYTEAHHLDVIRQRIVQDSTRYNQVGAWDGWLEVEGLRIEVDRWWGARDHSWGVRSGVGGFEPSTGSPPEPGLWVWACFSGEDYACQFQVREDGEGRRVYFDGQLDYATDDGRSSCRAVDVEHEIRFTPGARMYEHARFRLRLDDGRQLDIEAEPLVRAWAYLGTGYDGGYSDRKGLGAWRGEVCEHDIYDLSDVEQVTVDGATHPAGHREQPARVVVDGFPTLGHLPVMPRGTLPRYGLD